MLIVILYCVHIVESTNVRVVGSGVEGDEEQAFINENVEIG